MGTREHRARRTPSDSDGDDQLLTADQVAALLGVRRAWVYEQSRLGRIPTVALGRYRRYRRSAIAEWLVELETPAQVRAAR